MEILKETEKLAWIDRQMRNNEDCDVIIKKRDGIITYAVVRPILAEIRAEFCLLYNEEK